MGLNDLKADSVEVTTKLSVSDIGVILQEICAEWKQPTKLFRVVRGH